MSQLIVAISGTTSTGQDSAGVVYSTNDAAQKTSIAFVCIYIFFFASTWVSFIFVCCPKVLEGGSGEGGKVELVRSSAPPRPRSFLQQSVRPLQSLNLTTNLLFEIIILLTNFPQGPIAWVVTGEIFPLKVRVYVETLWAYSLREIRSAQSVCQ